MTSTSDPSAEPQVVLEEATQPTAPAEPPPSFTKLAMRNMVRKRTQSLVHFALTASGLLALLIGLSYLTR